MTVTLVPFTARRSDASWVQRGTSLRLRVIRWDEHRDGPVTEGALQGKLTSLGYDLLPLVDPHGALVSPRVHPLDRADAVIAGLLKVTVEGESAILIAGDIVLIPGGAVRRVEPVGTSPVLCVEAVCRANRA
jgi:mannose-6-phosphate isomerase-like protein (cupin superfamily)